MSGDGDLADRMDAVARRVEFLELLAEEGPLATRDVVDALDHSRSTVTRALRSLREADLVEKRAGGYEATLAGGMAADEYRRYERTQRAVLSSSGLLAAVPDRHALPVEVLTDAETVVVEETGPVRPLEAVADRVHRADRVRASLPTLINTHLLRGWYRSVVGGAADAEVAVDPDLLTVLKGQYPGLLAEMAAVGGFSVVAATGPPYGVFLTTTDGTTTLSVVVYEDDSAVRGVLTNDTPDAVEWARRLLDDVVADGDEVTADLAELGAAADGGGPPVRPDRGPTGRPDQGAGPAAPPGRKATAPGAESDGAVPSATGTDPGPGVPMPLEAEGFVHLSADYFETAAAAPPEVGWRTGFTLAEVRAGHAVDRRDEEGNDLTERLVDDLRDGTDRVLLGPPGSGKSTVCRSVACRWYDRGLGPVWYRERGGGDRFESTALLEAVLRRTPPDGHALVVVEDAVRDEASAVFEVVRCLEGDRSVTFLLDARTHEWDETGDGDVEPRVAAHRRRAVERVPVPGMDERECERFVERFEALVGTGLDLSGTELFDLVESGSTPDRGDSPAAGDALVAQHYLARRYDHAATGAGRGIPDGSDRPPTALEAAARRTFEELSEDGSDLVTDLAAMVALLAAAGVPVAEEYLHATAGDDDAVDGAIAALEGRLLFDRQQPRGRSGAYRTRHEAWATSFLAALLDAEPTECARRRVGRCVTRLLGLADDADRRERIERLLGGRTPFLHRIEADPGGWADELVDRLFGVGRTDPGLAPLFGETTDEYLQLPAACSGWTRLQATYWRGWMHRRAGNYARAEREFRRLGERAETVPLPDGTVDPPTPEYLGDDVGGGTPETHRERWWAASRTELGRIACRRDDLAAAEARHREALDGFEAVDDRRGVATSHKNIGWTAYVGGDYEKAREHLERSLAIAREVDARDVEAAASSDLGVVAQEQGDYAAAREHHERTLAIDRERGDRRRIAQARKNLGIVARLVGDYDEAGEQFEAALAIDRELGDRSSEAYSLGNLGNVAQARGDFDRARKCYEESLAIVRTLGDRRGVARNLNNLGNLAEKRGAYDEARDRFGETLAISFDLDDRRGIARGLNNLGRIARVRDDPDRAREHFEEALDVARELGDRRGEGITLTNLGRVARAVGEYDRAGDYLDRGTERFEAVGATDGLAEARLERARLAEARDDHERARERAQTARRTFEELDLPLWTARCRLLLGRVAAATDAPEEARDHWLAAVESFEGLGAFPDALATVEELVELCREHDDEEDAREWCERARDLLAAAPDPTADRHREWVERHAAALA